MSSCLPRSLSQFTSKSRVKQKNIGKEAFAQECAVINNNNLFQLELLGKSIYSLVHEDDQELLRSQLLPRSQALGIHGELLVPNDQEGRQKVAQVLANEKRRFIIR